ncbi:DNA cytosine methyltransferase [Methanopyrus kandleri]
MKPKVVDLFCGAGGFSRGFKEAGFKILGGVENNPTPAATYRENFPEAEVIERDIQRVDAEEIVDELGEPDVIIGGPPCEPFTAANAERKPNPLDRLYDDPVGRLVLHFVRIIGDLQPEVFVMENVPAIMEGPLEKALRKEFSRAGYYEIHFNVLQAVRYGVPSYRRRVFISNVRIDPEPTVERPKTVWEAIGDLPDPDSEVPNHELRPLSKRKLHRIRRLRWGEALSVIRGARGSFKNWLRLHPFKPAPTVMGGSRFIHPFEDRLLTVREQARLMSYPDDHVFEGGYETQYDQVGESVPPELARVIAEEVRDHLA